MAQFGDIVLNLMFLIIGIICIYVSIQNLKQKNIGNFIFWLLVGIALGLGKWIELYGNQWFPSEKYSVGSIIVGIIVVAMTIPAILGKVVSPKNKQTPHEEIVKKADKIGFKIFIPALTMGFTSLLFALFLPKIGAMPGLGIGVLLAAIILLSMSKDKPVDLLKGSRNLLDAVGPLSMLPQLLASLGAVFTAAGVGKIVADAVGYIVPQGNITIGIIVYALGMALFTMIMGNAFAAFSVMTVGIGIPFVLQFGYNPNVIGMLALTSGFCGTLLTPMAANFNILPVAVLEMKNKYTVIKNQVFVALCMLVIQIIMMLIFK